MVAVRWISLALYPSYGITRLRQFVGSVEQSEIHHPADELTFRPHRARKGKAAIRFQLGSHGNPRHGQPSMRVFGGNHHERAYPGVGLVEAGDELIVFAARA